MSSGRRRRRSPTLDESSERAKLTATTLTTHGGCAYGIPKKLSVEPSTVPTTVARSSCTCEFWSALTTQIWRRIDKLNPKTTMPVLLGVEDRGLGGSHGELLLYIARAEREWSETVFFGESTLSDPDGLG